MLFANIISFTYTIAWSISFYGQFYQNFKHKSVQGMSLDFLALNICGFAFYALYSSIGFFTSLKGAGTVVLADIVFAYHALIMVLIWLCQTFIYPHGKNRLSRRAIYICQALWAIVGIQTLLTCVFKVMPWNDHLNPVSSLGYCKLALTAIKFIPVAYWNYSRQSTFGWSICGVLSDLVGGAFSLLSGLLLTHNGINMSKLGLALISIMFDLFFSMQHFCLYGQKKETFHEMNEVDFNEGNVNSQQIEPKTDVRMKTDQRSEKVAQ